MNYKQRVTIFSMLAIVAAATSAITAANPTIRPIFIVLPLVLMGIFLFFAGYFAGLSKVNK